MTTGKDQARQVAEAIVDDWVARGGLIRLGANRMIDAATFFARSGSGWEPAACLLAVAAPGRRKRTPGFLRKGLFIHCVQGRGWSVTHFATGYKITGFTGVTAEAAEAARAFGEAIAGLADWERIRSLKAWEKARTPELIEAVHQAAKAVASPTVH
jgi:hypothetical protein